MRPPRGRRYWGADITLYSVTTNAGGSDPMGDSARYLTELQALLASVQTLGRDAALQAGLDTTREYWWIRTIAPAHEVTRDKTRVRWRGVTMKLEHISPGVIIPGEDLELITSRDDATYTTPPDPEPDPEPEPEPGNGGGDEP
jgi:hypothetical protein